MARRHLYQHQRRQLKHFYTKRGFKRTRLYGIGKKVFSACPCYYCGEIATTEDHVLPLVALQQLYGIIGIPRLRHLLVVPSCKECNFLLGTKVFSTLKERKKWIKIRLGKKYKRILQLPTWEKKELNELDYRLKEYIILGLRRQENLRSRLEW